MRQSEGSDACDVRRCHRRSSDGLVALATVIQTADEEIVDVDAVELEVKVAGQCETDVDV
jgi:hypothetical protein